MSKILIVSDAYIPQVNGVVTTITNVEKQLCEMGHEVRILSFKDCRYSFTLPLYKEVKMGFIRTVDIRKSVEWADAIHISTPEGTVGFRALRYCVRNKVPFTTGYHTKWPEFIRARLPISTKITYSYMRWLHKHSKVILVPTLTSVSELKAEKFKNLSVWSRGVDRDKFKPRLSGSLNTKPILLCVSRASHEKGLDDFCKLTGDYTKVLAGDGPYLETLKNKYKDVKFLGMMHGKELADLYANADVFVFPSKTDTFGVVMIESMACGTPVAAYPVTGPIDVIDAGITGIMNTDLHQAVLSALNLDRKIVYESSQHWTWKKCAEEFYDSLFLVKNP